MILLSDCQEREEDSEDEELATKRLIKQLLEEQHLDDEASGAGIDLPSGGGGKSRGQVKSRIGELSQNLFCFPFCLDYRACWMNGEWGINFILSYQ